MIKSYHEMMTFDNFHDRLNYLQLYGKIGEETFGDQRYLNQTLYHTSEWKSTRERVIIRDNACDMALPDYEIRTPPVYVHHINPLSIDDILNQTPKVFDMDNLVTVSQSTHMAIHYGDNEAMKMCVKERTPNDTCPWKTDMQTVTMIIGLPGSGKSTLAKKLIGDTGLCYDLDALAGALCLAGPHEALITDSAKRLAWSFRKAFLEESKKHTKTVVIIRTAPTTSELHDIKPDKIVVCQKQWVARPYRYDITKYKLRINEAIKWAKINNVTIEMETQDG